MAPALPTNITRLNVSIGNTVDFSAAMPAISNKIAIFPKKNNILRRCCIETHSPSNSLDRSCLWIVPSLNLKDFLPLSTKLDSITWILVLLPFLSAS